MAERPRFASTVRPESVPVAAAEGVRHSPAVPGAAARFPVLDDRDDLVDELLDLYTARNLYALHAILTKIDIGAARHRASWRSCSWRWPPASCPRAG